MSQLTNAQVRDVENLLHPTTNLAQHREEGPLFIERGEGIYVYDSEGNRYIEGLAGLWCVGLGWGNAEMVETARAQMERLAYTHLFGGRSFEGAVELAETIKELLPTPMARVFFACSGGEANDTHIKIAWYVANAKGETGRKKILSRRGGYHGLTVMAGSATGIQRFHTDFDLPFANFVHLTTPHYWKESKDGETEEEFTARLAAELEDTIEQEDPATIAAFIAEPILGAGGVVHPPAGYFEAVGTVLERHSIPLIDDEVICGFGRTGEWFGATTYGMRPNAYSMAKQLTSAYAPLSAIAIDQETADILEDQSRKIGIFGHGFTYGGHPLGIALGIKAIEIYRRDGILDHVRRATPYFHKKLSALSDHPLVGEVRSDGKTLIAGIELAADPEARAAFNPVGRVGYRAMQETAKNGLLVRAIGDTVALCPPMIITEEQVDEMIEALTTALDATEDWVRKEGLRDS